LGKRLSHSPRVGNKDTHAKKKLSELRRRKGRDDRVERGGI